MIKQASQSTAAVVLISFLKLTQVFCAERHKALGFLFWGGAENERQKGNGRSGD